MHQTHMPAIFVSLAVIASAAGLGGWPWALVAAIALFEFHRGKDHSVAGVLKASVVSLIFLVLFVWTQDRRMFFPYSMQYALQLACLWSGRFPYSAVAGGALVTMVFVAIRIVQGATVAVLAVEIAVAAVSLAIGLAVYARSQPSPAARATAALAASLVAYAGLMF